MPRTQTVGIAADFGKLAYSLEGSIRIVDDTDDNGRILDPSRIGDSLQRDVKTPYAVPYDPHFDTLASSFVR